MSRAFRRVAIGDAVSSRPVTSAVVIALGALVFTTGPLYRVRTWWNHDDPLAADVAVVAVQAIFGLLGVAVLLADGRWRRVDRRLGDVAMMLVAWMALSALWSADVATTLRESSMVALTLVAGTGAAVAVGERMLVFAGWVGVHIGLAWSAVAIVTLQPGTQDIGGQWAGVYFNSNSLALVAAVGILLSAVMVAQHWRRQRRLQRLAVVGAAVLADLWLISGTGSLTPLVALLGGVAVAGCAIGARRLVAPGGGWEHRERGVAAAAGLAIVVVTLCAFLTRSAWLGWFGRSSTLTGRTEIWDVALDWWSDRPLGGHGYFGAWADPQFVAEQIESRGELLGSTHNSFIELLLGTGVIGFALAVALFVLLWMAAGRRALTGSTAAAAWPLTVLVFVIVENLAETLWVGGQVAVVLVGVLIVVSTAQEPSDDSSAGVPHSGDETDSRPTGSISVGADRTSGDGIADDRAAQVVPGERRN